MGLGRTPESGLPTAVELLYLVVGHCLVGQQDEIRLGRVAQEIAVEAQAVFAHVGGHAHRGDGRQSGVLFQWIEVAEPHNLVGGIGHLPAPAVVDETAYVPAPVGDDAHTVGPQGPDFRFAVFIPLDSPERRPPQVQVDLGGPPEFAAGVPMVHTLQDPLGRMVLPHRDPASRGVGPVDDGRRPAKSFCSKPDGRVYRYGRGVILAVFGPRPSTVDPREASEPVHV